MRDPAQQRTADWSLSSYEFALPQDRIAQRPAARRDRSRLMVVDPATPSPEHARFSELLRFVRPGDVLVVNDSQVTPARLRGHKETGGNVEILLLEPLGENRWNVLFRSSKQPKPGASIEFAAGVKATWVASQGGGRAILSFPSEAAIGASLGRIAEVPLPPYIRRPFGPDRADRDRYQTVYARSPGSVAAPTAGLHFTLELLEELRREGVLVAPVTLHVGPATFQPVRSEDLSQLSLAGERYEIPQSTVDVIEAARESGGRVIAVGTTTTRALESATGDHGVLSAGAGVAEIAIRPGYRMRSIDGLITNFHLPRSSLLVLLAAFIGRELVQRCYREAVELGYQFYSYGDAMLAWAPRGDSVDRNGLAR